MFEKWTATPERGTFPSPYTHTHTSVIYGHTVCLLFATPLLLWIPRPGTNGEDYGLFRHPLTAISNVTFQLLCVIIARRTAVPSERRKWNERGGTRGMRPRHGMAAGGEIAEGCAETRA